MKKVLFLLVTLFLIQFVISCHPCNCSNTSYDVIYDGINLNAINTSKFQPQIIEEYDTVYRNIFALGVVLQYDLEERTGMVLPSASYGFSSAMACSCYTPRFYPDGISHAKVFVIDTNTDEKTEITTNFGVHSPQADGFISLEEFFDQKDESQNYFIFQLLDGQNIPNSSVFTVETHLFSGEILSQSSSQIIFYD
jgi:hypothetical protein